jgi:hypothetical protein
MQQIEIEDFIIRDVSVVCPACYTPFATPQLVAMPALTPQSPVEADLHRVLPSAAVRGALISICPACIYTWWATAFANHFFVPDLLVPSPEIEYPKKFAHAVLTGRKNGVHALDRALVAMNGLWCARETYIGAGQELAAEYKTDNEKWLVLAVQELDEALKDPHWQGNRSRYSYMMGELLRQMGDFHSAVRYFDLVDRSSLLPAQLVRHQRDLAVAGNAASVRLPPHLVESIFLPQPIILAEPETPINDQAAGVAV